MNEIFAEQHVQDTALDVHRQAMTLSLKDRFDFLSDWVLPGKAHDSLRINVGFTQTSPGPGSADYVATASQKGALPRQASGGELISPAWDLIEAAESAGQLAALRNQVSNWEPNQQPDGELDKASMLTLIDIASPDKSPAAQSVELLLKAIADRPVAGGPSPGELLVFVRGVHVSAMREAVSEASNRYVPWMNADFYRSPFKRHFKSARSQLRTFQRVTLTEPTVPMTDQPLKQWTVVTRSRAKSRGMGCPTSRWDYQPGYVENVASHDEDYLYFRIPLRGNFEVECDVSGFGWRDTHLMVGGVWVAPVYTHAGYDLGNFHATWPRVEFSPPMTKTKEWIHYRTVVRDRVVSTYFNGRLMRQATVSPDHDPWLAIRSSPRHDGAVRNLRITGQPVIPEEIRLSVDPNFNGWVSYYDYRVGQNGEWRQAGSRDSGGEIIGSRAGRPGNFVTSLFGAFSAAAIASDQSEKLPPHKERLLRYHRPMLENGTIDYEFYYSPGTILAHPAIDRLAFLLKPDGVKVHWITDGEHDRSGLSPTNKFDEPDNRAGPDQLPLKAGDWNRLQLRLNGDTVTLSLNGQDVYERLLEATNQRTFGLFHFADETQARIRNVVWKGDWPRELPPLAEQELAIDDTSFLDRDLEQLSAVFEHDFTKAGLPLEQFRILKGDPKAHVRHVADGVLTTRPGTGGFRNATIAPALAIQGDFDIIASYRDFESSAAEGGNSTAMLMTIMDNATADECSVTRRHIHRTNNVHENVSLCITVARRTEGDRREYFGVVPMEEKYGRFRLSRRGDQMYFLTAERDSPHFQLRGQRQVATDPIQAEGLRLLTQIYQKGGEVSATWSHLIVRAEKLSGRAVEDIDSQLVQLNEERDKLKSRFTFDFSQEAPPETLFRRWTDQRQWNKSDGGLLIVAPGTDNWTSAGVSVMKPVTGDFDISVEFDVLKFDVPKVGQRCSAYVQIELPDKDNSQISLIFTNNDTGATEVISQVREPRGPGKYHYRPTGTIDLTDVTALRMARRGERITFLASTRDSKQERIVGYLNRPAVPILASSLRFFVHTGGADRESRVLWKSIDIRADEISPTDSPEPARRGLLDSAIDFFKGK